MLGATVEGDTGKVIDDIAGLDQATTNCLSFLANPKYEPLVYTTSAGALLVSVDFVPKSPVSASLIRVEDPYSAFTTILEFVSAQLQQTPRGIHATAVIEQTAEVGDNVYLGAYSFVSKGAQIGSGAVIHPFVFIGPGATIGKETVIYPHVAIYHGTKIGDRCRIHSGTVIGADGFGFAPQADGTFKKIPQLGIVEVEHGVEIGSNTCIDRATIGKTVIKAGVKLDNLVQVAHNVEIGEHTVVAAQSGISGSTTLGKSVMVGGQAGFVGHIHIADGTRIDAQSGVNKSIKEPNLAFRGSPIQVHRQQLKSELYFRKLVDMEARIRDLEAKLDSASS